MLPIEHERWWPFLSGSKEYLEAAKRLVEPGGSRKILFRPTLHLLSQGIELIIKYALVEGGMAESDLKNQKKYGHHIKKLWRDPLAAPIRSLAAIHAGQSWKAAKASGKFQDVFEGEPEKILEEQLFTLSDLHDDTFEYPLRYVVPEGTTGPRAPFLVDAFWRVADECVRQPRLIAQVRG